MRKAKVQLIVGLLLIGLSATCLLLLIEDDFFTSL